MVVSWLASCEERSTEWPWPLDLISVMSASRLRAVWSWLLINATGMVIYVAIGAWIKAPRPEGYQLNGIDEIYLWVTRMLPVLAVVAVLDAIWLLILLKSQERPTQLRFWLSTCLVWCAVLFYNGLAIKVGKIVIAVITGEARK